MPAGPADAGGRWRPAALSIRKTWALLVLLGNEQRYRVVDALASDGPAFASVVTYSGSHPTDIPQDFGFDKTAIAVTVPAGAVYLFFAKSDAWYHDNTDPDHDYGVLIGLAPVPVPAPAALWLAGLAGLPPRRARHSVPLSARG